MHDCFEERASTAFEGPREEGQSITHSAQSKVNVVSSEETSEVPTLGVLAEDTFIEDGRQRLNGLGHSSTTHNCYKINSTHRVFTTRIAAAACAA